MVGHYFISYSPVDCLDLAFRIYEHLTHGEPHIPAWLDKRNLRFGYDYDEQIDQAIKSCAGLLFLMSRDSVNSLSECHDEWDAAWHYKKPVIPLLVHHDAERPYRLRICEYLDFTGDFDAAISALEAHLRWLRTPEGQVAELELRQKAARRDLKRAPANQIARIEDEIKSLETQIEALRRIISDPAVAVADTLTSITTRLALEQQPFTTEGLTSPAASRFINAPPGEAPRYFQDRATETKLIAEFLSDDGRRMFTVVGRGGAGKTAVVCRLLKALQSGHLPEDSAPLAIDGIVYLSAIGTHGISPWSIFTDICRLLPEAVAQPLRLLYDDPLTSITSKFEALLRHLQSRPIVLLLDNFEDLVGVETRQINQRDLVEALVAILKAPTHRLKVLVTTRVGPIDLTHVEPSRQTCITLDEGLPSPFAENVMRALDVDGKLGLRDAPDALLREARERTRGNPSALHHLFAILSGDHDCTLESILRRTDQMLPDEVMDKWVGEAYSRLDANAQRVMEALAVYSHPVPPVAADFLLQPWVPTIDSAPILSRLVNMQLVRREGGRYYLHPIDRAYARSRVPPTVEGDPDRAAYTLPTLLDRGAEYYRRTYKPRANWKGIDDLEAPLREFGLRCERQDFDMAAHVLLAIDWEYLWTWGHYQLIVELHQKLENRLADAQSASLSLGTIGSALAKMAMTEEAISYQTRAMTLARDHGLHGHEYASLSNLAIRSLDLGQIELARQYAQGALDLATPGQMSDVLISVKRTLGAVEAAAGRYDQAREYFDEAIALARAKEERRKEAGVLVMLGNLEIDIGDADKAVNDFQQGCEKADVLGFVEVQHLARAGLALAGLMRARWSEAKAFADEAERYDLPENEHRLLVVKGLAALRMSDRPVAVESFQAAIRRSGQIIERCRKAYAAWDSRGLALAGLVACGSVPDHAEAIAALREARKTVTAQGIINRLSKLMSVLQGLVEGRVWDDLRRAAMEP